MTRAHGESLPLGLLSLLVLVASMAGAAGNEELGPKVGEMFPAFEAPDQTGQLRSLEELAGAQGLVLVFYRSADW